MDRISPIVGHPVCERSSNRKPFQLLTRPALDLVGFYRRLIENVKPDSLSNDWESLERSARIGILRRIQLAIRLTTKRVFLRSLYVINLAYTPEDVLDIFSSPD